MGDAMTQDDRLPGDQSGPAEDLSAPLAYRGHSTTGRRRPRGLMRYSDAEWAVISVTAARDGMVASAWAQQIAHEVARRRQHGELPDHAAVDEVLEELRALRRQLRNIGGNLNDLTKVADSTGEVDGVARLEAVLDSVGTRVRAIDSMTTHIRAKLLT